VSGVGQRNILRKLVMINDKSIETLLQSQINDPGNRYDGAANNRHELPNEHSTYSFIVKLASSYASEFSKYNKSEKIERSLKKAISFLLRVQNEDGTIDLYSTNFHSTPDTGFLVNYLSPVYTCLSRMNIDGVRDFLGKLESFITRAGKCLLVGGIHTANHRWVVSAALARLYSMNSDPKFIERIDEWLSEGIDLDPDGQYHERSVSVYSPVCNNMFLTIGKLLDRPDLLEIVRKNLEMSLYYIHPDGEVLTDASDRQDNVMTRYVNEYYYAYRYFAIKDNNPRFAAVCELIESKMPERITRYILPLMEEPLFKKEMLDASMIPDDYFKRFEHSGVFRIRRGNIDISVIEENPTFLSFRNGNSVLQSMRIGAAFFGRGQFVAEEAEQKGNSVILKRSVTRGYYQPLSVDLKTGNNGWIEHSRETRAGSEEQTLDYEITITEDQGSIVVDVEIKGCDHVPVSWELSFREGGVLEGVTTDRNIDGVYYIEGDQATYRIGKDAIQFGPGIAEHKWTQMRSVLPKQEGMSVYLTGYTPFKHTLTLS
ncbi:MAG: hypothetical protein ACI9FN_001731, partial [Saprospiraceae bacterium]